MLKTLLLQLLTQRTGDRDVFKVIMEAYAASATLDCVERQEEKLWASLSAALNKAQSNESEKLAIIIK